MENSTAAEDNIEASTPSVTRVSASHGGDFRRMAGHGQPIVNGGADPSPRDRRFTGPLVACNQQDEPVSCPDGILERAVDRRPGAIEAVAVQVECPVRNDRP